MFDFSFVLALVGCALVFLGVVSRRQKKPPSFEEFLEIVDGRCRYCGSYSPEGVKDVGYWIELTCSSCGKKSRVHLRSQ